MKVTRRLLVIGIGILLSSAAMAENPRLIAVEGEGEVRVAPDHAVITLGVETWNKNLNTAKQVNDEAVTKVLSTLSRAQIPAGDIQTSYISVEPTWENQYDTRSNPVRKLLTGYTVQKTMAVTLRDLAKFDQVLAVVQEGGANRVDGVEFRHSQLRKYRDQARAMAIKAAKEKAEALTHEIGQKIGKAYSITESAPVYWFPRAQMQNAMQNVSSAGDSRDPSESTVSPGKISIKARVAVSFDLE